MEQPIENYSKLRLTDLKAALEANNFEVHLTDDRLLTTTQAACNF